MIFLQQHQTSGGHAFPLSTAQQGLWAAELLSPESNANVTGQFSEITGPVDPAVFSQASRQVIDETEALRLCFGGPIDAPVQWVRPLGDWSCPVLDFSTRESPRAEALAWMHEQLSAPRHLDGGRAFTWALLRLGPEHFLWCFEVHHLLMDGFSRNLVWRRLEAVYSALAAGRVPAPSTSGSVRELLGREEAYRASARFEEDRRYWRALLAGRPPRVSLSGKAQASGHELRRVTRHLPKTSIEKLLLLSPGASLAQVLVAASALYQRANAGTSDVLLGFAVSARLGADARLTPAMLSNVVPLRLRLGAKETPARVVHEAGRTIREVLRHQRYPSQDLRQDLTLSPLEPDPYAISVNVMPFDQGATFCGYPARTHNLSNGPVADLALGVFDGPSEADVRVDLNGNRALYEEPELAAHLDQFFHLLDEMAGGAPAGASFAKQERARQPEPPLLAERFEAMARAQGDAIALVDGVRCVTYRELLLRADALAAVLQARGIGPGSLVGVALPRSAELVIAVVGVCRAGAAYVPIDLAHPAQRRALILADSTPRAVITDGTALEGLPPGAEILSLPAESAAEAQPRPRPAAEDPAYVIYTSGSTGQPNGVLVTQRNVARLFTATEPLFAFGPGDVWTLFHSIAFDFSVWELWGPLLTGGRLVIVESRTAREADAFHALVLREGVTILNQTPGAFRAFDAADAAAERPRSRLRQVIFGGESLDPRTLRGWFDAHGDQQPRLVNMYGITETTVHVTFRPMSADDARGPGKSLIGVPLGDLGVELLDADERPVADGEVGEIWVTGRGVADGYLRRPALTARRFRRDAQGEPEAARRYRSGDLGRRLPDGSLEYLGRADLQVKLRGFRIELGEIEAALREAAGVRDVVVALREVPAVGSQLVAYVVGAALDRTALREQLAGRLPDYMVPAAFVPIEAIPRTVNDKVDRSALPAPSAQDLPTAGQSDGESRALPQDHLERAVAQLYSEVLKLRIEQRDADFFRLGGHSLLAARLSILCQQRLLVSVPVRSVFEHPTVAALAAFIRAEKEQGRRAAPARRPVARSPGQPLLCSPWQTWLWRLQQLDPSDTTAVVFRAVRSDVPLDPNRLEEALRALARRHEPLRCRFTGDMAGEPRLDLRSADELVLRRLAQARGPELARSRAAERARPFNLSAELPLRATLAPDADHPGSAELWISIHHIAYDGASEEIFWRELAATYQNLGAGRPPLDGLLPLQASFTELVARQREELDEERLQALEQRWRERLAGAPERLRLSWRGGDNAGSTRALQLRRELPAEVTASLRELSRERHTSVAMLSLAAFEALLFRWSGECDQLIAVDYAGRAHADEQQQIGLFTSPLALRASLAFDPTLIGLALANRELLADALADALADGGLPFDRLVAALGSGRRRLSGFRIFFSHQLRGEARELGGGALQEVALEELSARTDLRLTMEERPSGLVAQLVGSAALFDQGDLARLADGFSRCVSQLCRTPEIKLSELEWLSEPDRRSLALWNDTSAGFPRDQPLTALLRAQAQRSPDAVALEAGDEKLSYAGLWQRADALAARLRGLGVTRGARVGLYLDRHARLPEAMLGVLEAGGTYLPLDPGFPRERLAFMIDDASASVILTRRALLAELPPHRAEVVCVDEELPAAPCPPSWQGPDATSLAYLLYTSGSTGTPKGVEVEHRSLVNFLASMARRPGLTAADTLLAVTSLSFDIAGLELWLPLLVGARIFLAGREEAADGGVLQTALARSAATVLQATPSTWRALFASGWRGDPKLKALVGGEALPPDLAERLSRSCGEAWNLYGPTETTIWSSAFRLQRPAAAVRVGTPIDNTELHVLDERLRPQPIGVTGELYIGGEGVARGYLNRPELTAQRFLPDPFRGGPWRLYRTGDLARWLPDGTLDLLGRNDDQLKVRGHRIEAGEIEAALLRLPDVAQAAVALYRPQGSDPRLVAWLVARPGAALLPSSELRALLRQWLAEYMLPYHFVQIDALLLTPNGKVDRQRLLSLFQPSTAEEGAEASNPGEKIPPRVAELTAEFKDLLKRTASADTDFFEAGGDSIAALRLLARLTARYPGRLGTSDLFLHSTPRRLAARLDDLVKGQAAPRGHLVPLREGGQSPPLFLVHPVGGQLEPYVCLAGAFPKGIPLFGLQAHSDDGRSYDSLEERAAAYVREMTAAWSGPFTLGGYSLGGLLAMEVASQLRQAGHEVPLVFMLDAAVGTSRKVGLDKLRFRLQELRRFSWFDRAHWARSQLDRLIGTRQPDLGEGAMLIDPDEMSRLLEHAQRWEPPHYDGRVLVFRAGMHVRGYSNAPSQLGWDALCSELEVLTLHCNHAQMVLEPYASRVAAEIARRLHPGLHPAGHAGPQPVATPGQRW